MKETKTIDSTARQEYEPMEIKVMTVTPVAVLCGSGGGASGGGSGIMSTSYTKGSL